MTASQTDIASWNQNADQYAQLIGVAEDKIYSAFKEVLWDSLGDLHGLSVLDAGCGHGWLAKVLLDAGANVVGVDGSTALLAKAQELCPQTQFIEWDLAQGLPVLEQRFDRILAHMVLMDLPEIDPLLHAVRASLPSQPDGLF